MNNSVKDERRRPAPGDEGGDCSDIVGVQRENPGLKFKGLIANCGARTSISWARRVLDTKFVPTNDYRVFVLQHKGSNCGVGALVSGWSAESPG